MTNESVPSSVRPEPVASRKHSAVFVGIVALIVFAGSAAQSGRTTTALDANHPNVIPLYLSATLMNWLLVYFVWRGIRRRGLTLRSLIRGRWQSAREIIRDFALAALLWGLLWVVIWGLDRLPLPASTESLDAYLPRGVPEVTVW
ncbi:MAG: hypothetical protein KC729_02950, partial [Candidatus Eisenbacteria bacterium]|nr:hypothetical protein [Candidatus Eisenbacteria bacterium]